MGPTLLLHLSLLFLSFTFKAFASTSTGSPQLLFNILYSTADNGDPIQGWNASKLIDSIDPNWKPNLITTKDEDLIPTLPGQPENTSFLKQYGGYVDIGEGENLYYYFVETTNNISRPVVLWINGGRGCSSIGGGAFLQNGPFLVNEDGKTLRENPYSWISNVNMLYLDIPINAGFSYSTKGEEKTLYNDEKTALSCFKFIIAWRQKFSDYQNKSVIIAGGGYAGMVLPRLADLIVEHNLRNTSSLPAFRFRKVALGNPTVDVESEILGVVDFQWMKGMISGKLREEVKLACKSSLRTDACKAAMRKLPVNDLGSGAVYPYDYLAQVCNPNLKPGLKIESYYECDELHVANYLGQKEVQKALHNKSPKVSGIWNHCNEEVESNYKSSKSSLPIMKDLASKGVIFLIHSGDTDLVVPTSGTRYAMVALDLVNGSQFNPWFTDPATVAGFVESYSGIAVNFAVVRTAGHVTSQRFPGRVLNLLQKFL